MSKEKLTVEELLEKTSKKMLLFEGLLHLTYLGLMLSLPFVFWYLGLDKGLAVFAGSAFINGMIGFVQAKQA